MSEDYFHHRNNAHRYQTTKITDDGDIQLIEAKGMTDEEHTDIMRVYPHGFSSHSPAGSHMIAMGLGGRRDNIVAIGGEHEKYRQRKLLEGEAVVYDMTGNIVKMVLGKGIIVNAKEGAVAVTAQEKSIDMVSKTDTTVAAEGKITTASKGVTTMDADGDFTVTSKAKLTETGAGDSAFGSTGGITYIGGNGADGDYEFVLTVAGISTKVKAKM